MAMPEGIEWSVHAHGLLHGRSLPDPLDAICARHEQHRIRTQLGRQFGVLALEQCRVAMREGEHDEQLLAPRVVLHIAARRVDCTARTQGGAVSTGHKQACAGQASARCGSGGRGSYGGRGGRGRCGGSGNCALAESFLMSSLRASAISSPAGSIFPSPRVYVRGWCHTYARVTDTPRG